MRLLRKKKKKDEEEKLKKKDKKGKRLLKNHASKSSKNVQGPEALPQANEMPGPSSVSNESNVVNCYINVYTF